MFASWEISLFKYYFLKDDNSNLSNDSVNELLILANIEKKKYKTDTDSLKKRKETIKST